MTKSSSSPVDALSGMSQIPTRGWPSMIVPVGWGDGGAWMFAFRRQLVTSFQRASILLFESTRMPLAFRPGILTSRLIASSNWLMPPLSEMEKADVG